MLFTSARKTLLFVISVGFLILLPQLASAADACCQITAIDARTNIATARQMATGQTFYFATPNATITSSLRVGQKIYANFGGGVVSLDGVRACCRIVKGAPSSPMGASGMGKPAPTPTSPGRTPQVSPAPLQQLTALPSVTFGARQRAQNRQNPNIPTRIGSTSSGVNNSVVSLRGPEGIQQAANLPPGLKNLLLLHAYTLGPGEVDHYVVNTKLANEWFRSHPALADVKPPSSHDSHAGCGSNYHGIPTSTQCVGEDAKHIADEATRQSDAFLKASRDEYDQVTHKLSHQLQMAESCFADQTLTSPEVPVQISPADVKDLVFRFNKGQVTGLVTLGLPIDAHFNAKVQMFWIPCLPFLIRPRSISADGTFGAWTKVGTEVTATGKFAQDFTVARYYIPLEVIPIVVAGIPIVELDTGVYMDGTLHVDGNGKLDAKFNLETQQQTNAFDFDCDGKRCGLNSHGLASKPGTTSESVKLDGRVNVQPAIYVALQLDVDFNALTVRAGPEPYLWGEVYGCGAASGTQTMGGGPSTAQQSYAATADLDWGIDLRAEALVATKQVAHNYQTLVKRRHIEFWDLAHSTALVPYVDGAAQASIGKPALYKIKMPTCYPYPDKVKYQLAWNGGATASTSAPAATAPAGSLQRVSALGIKTNNTQPSSSGSTSCNLQSGQGNCEFDPVKDFGLNLVWPQAGTYSLTVTAVGDTPHGREYKSPTPATMNITVQ